jgi:hypothetical protein
LNETVDVVDGDRHPHRQSGSLHRHANHAGMIAMRGILSNN